MPRGRAVPARSRGRAPRAPRGRHGRQDEGERRHASYSTWRIRTWPGDRTTRRSPLAGAGEAAAGPEAAPASRSGSPRASSRVTTSLDSGVASAAAPASRGVVKTVRTSGSARPGGQPQTAPRIRHPEPRPLRPRSRGARPRRRSPLRRPATRQTARTPARPARRRRRTAPASRPPCCSSVTSRPASPKVRSAGGPPGPASPERPGAGRPIPATPAARASTSESENPVTRYRSVRSRSACPQLGRRAPDASLRGRSRDPGIPRPEGCGRSSCRTRRSAARPCGGSACTGPRAGRARRAAALPSRHCGPAGGSPEKSDTALEGGGRGNADRLGDRRRDVEQRHDVAQRPAGLRPPGNPHLRAGRRSPPRRGTGCRASSRGTGPSSRGRRALPRGRR